MIIISLQKIFLSGVKVQNSEYFQEKKNCFDTTARLFHFPQMLKCAWFNFTARSFLCL